MAYNDEGKDDFIFLLKNGNEEYKQINWFFSLLFSAILGQEETNEFNRYPFSVF